MTDIRIRALVAEDAPAVHQLCAQLGYEMAFDVLAARLAGFLAASNRGACVACDATGRVLGFVHVYARPGLETAPEAVVQALAVDADARGRGVGRRLMAAAEDWARRQGLRHVALHTHVRRADAHAFYEALGYAHAGDARLYRRTLP